MKVSIGVCGVDIVACPATKRSSFQMNDDV